MTAEQPTLQELEAAFNNCCLAAGIGGAHAEAIQELRRLRNLKTTWVFKKENDFRFMVDRYLRENGGVFH